MSFSDDAWASVSARYADIVAHPFVVELGAGSLDEAVFVRYLVDDAHYLLSYARTLAALASRMPSADGVAELAGAAAGAIVAERELHRGFLVPRGIDPDAEGATGPTPACRAYTGFLAEQVATAPVEVALAAVVPCFRVYAEVGRHLVARAGPDLDEHAYRAWLATYSDREFDAAVTRGESHADIVAHARAASVPAMLDVCAIATDLEWRFWDAAWRGLT